MEKYRIKKAIGIRGRVFRVLEKSIYINSHTCPYSLETDTWKESRYEPIAEFKSYEEAYELVNKLKSSSAEFETLNKKLSEAEKLIDMVMDNRKMPHQHTDYYERLCCLAERAREYKEKFKSAS